MPPTGLNFYRKRQTFDALAQERPQNLQSVYTIVREVVAAMEERVVNLETSYYGPNGGPELEAKTWQLLIQLVIRPARQSGLFSLPQLNDIYDRHIDITDSLTVDEEALDEIQALAKKSLKVVREGFSETIDYIRKLLEYMARYCNSFSGSDGDSYLETATNYEKQRRDFEKAIKLNLENITTMADKFETDDLRVHQFDTQVKELAERLRIDHSPIALMFTAACHNMRNALKGLLLWVEADANYPKFLHYDIAELDTKRESQCKHYRECQVKANTCEFVVKALKKKIVECNDQLKRLGPREKTIRLEERKLRTKNKDVLVDLDIKEYRKLEMKLNGSLSDRDGAERYERLQTEIFDLKSRKPVIDRRITDLGRQQTWISERRTYTESKETELERLTAELRQARRLARKAEVELERQEANLSKLKEIHMLKTSQETLKKIFHNMPIIGRYSQPPKKKKDRLDKLCRIISTEIDGDWQRFYRLLPFYPHRGEETVSVDINDIVTRFLRNTEEQATQSLLRWRRMHTRACVDDLINALTAIKRKDIVEKFDSLVQPQPKHNIMPKMHRIVHFPKISERAKKKQHYLYF